MAGGALIPGLPDEMARECLIRVPFSRFHTVRAVSKLWLDEVESPHFHRLRKTHGLTHTLVAMAQSEPAVCSSPGRRKHHKYTTCSPIYRPVVFDPESSSWCAIPLPPSLSSAGLPLFCQLAGLTRELVVIGGCDPDTWAASDEVFIFDFLTAKWRAGAKMPGPRRSFFACAASASDRMVFVAGGHDEQIGDGLRRRQGRVGADAGHGAGEGRVQGDVRRRRPVPRRRRVRHQQGGPVREVLRSLRRRRVEVGPGGGRCPRVEHLPEHVRRGGARPEAVPVPVGEAGGGGGGGRGWRDVAEIPMDARVAPNLVAWREEVVVVGSGWHDGPHVAYRTGKEKGGFEWTKLKVPEEYSGQVQALCCLEV